MAVEFKPVHELEVMKILADFLPDRIFDAHAHVLDSSFMPGWSRVEAFTAETYRADMGPFLCNPKTIKVNMVPMPNKTMGDPTKPTLQKMDEYILSILEQDPDTVGEVMVYPGETAEHLASRLKHPRLTGIKCYHALIQRQDTWNAGIEEFLPESAWEVANDRGLGITLHMVKDKALSDPDNMEYIRTMAKRYPNAKLILAHAARAFAAWTGVETVEKLADLENIWFDLAAVCESPAIFQILDKVSKERCMWGSDYPLVQMPGKVFSLGDGFYWLYERDIKNFVSPTPIHPWPIAVENLMATRQACIMARLTAKEVEDVFYNNAARLFGTN